jgi:GDP-mannose 6-dehydrogenase
VKDFHNPPFTVLGGANAAELAPLRGLYNSICAPVFETTIRTAEMVKYACNAFHALKVGFANEMGTLGKELGVDTQAAMEIFKSDTRLNISTAYLSPGFAFGGSCLPKDLRALIYSAKELDVRLPLLESILPSNAQHIERAVDAVLSTGRNHVGVLGLSFKAGTDDLRESPLVQVIKRLLGEGLRIRIWDPDVTLGRLVGSNRQYIEEVIPHIGVLLCSDLREVVEMSEVVLIGSPAAERSLLDAMLRRDQFVIDLVNLNPTSRTAGGGTYQGICW